MFLLLSNNNNKNQIITNKPESGLFEGGFDGGMFLYDKIFPAAR